MSVLLRFISEIPGFSFWAKFALAYGSVSRLLAVSYSSSSSTEKAWCGVGEKIDLG
jgi:hypothetical protein